MAILLPKVLSFFATWKLHVGNLPVEHRREPIYYKLLHGPLLCRISAVHAAAYDEWASCWFAAMLPTCNFKASLQHSVLHQHQASPDNGGHRHHSEHACEAVGWPHQQKVGQQGSRPAR